MRSFALKRMQTTEKRQFSTSDDRDRSRCKPQSALTIIPLASLRFLPNWAQATEVAVRPNRKLTRPHARTRKLIKRRQAVGLVECQQHRRRSNSNHPLTQRSPPPDIEIAQPNIWQPIRHVSVIADHCRWRAWMRVHGLATGKVRKKLYYRIQQSIMLVTVMNTRVFRSIFSIWRGRLNQRLFASF